MILGRFDRSLIAAEDRASTLVMGPTQLAGKSSRVVIPTILEWDGPVLTTSIKRDTLDASLPRRQELGEVKVFDPLGRTGIPTATWSPVAASASWTQAREVASHLMQVGWEQAKQDKDPHWRPAAARHLAPLLLAAYAGKKTLADVGRWIDTAERDEPEQLLARSVDANAGRAREVLSSLWLKDQRYASSVYATLEEGLDPWQEPSIAAATAAPDITAEWLLSASNTLYIVGGGHDQRRLASLYGALLMRTVDDALAIASWKPRQRLDTPLLCALDEVANIAAIPALGRYASAGLGPGVLLLTVLQDYSQALEHWGQERAQSIMANHTAKLFASGIGDPADAALHRRAPGPRARTAALRAQGQRQQIHHHGRALRAARAAVARAPGQRDTALLVYGRIPPAWITLRAYYKDRGSGGWRRETGRSAAPRSSSR